MKSKMYCFFFGFIFLAVSLFPAMAKEMNPLVVEAANDGLMTYLQKIPESMKEKYGFDQTDNLTEARLAKPINIAVIRETPLDTPDENLQSFSTNTDMWYFPVIIKGKIKSILIVDKVGEQWKAVSLGYSTLARELEGIKSQWPESKGYTISLSMNPQVKKYFFSIPEFKTENLTVIDFKDKSKKKYTVLNEAKETLSLLKTTLKELKENNRE